jgi:hypothetical protein
MDIMWIAIAVDMLGYGLLGALIVFLGRRRLPSPWNEPSVTIAAVLTIGALITMATFTHWRVYPG